MPTYEYKCTRCGEITSEFKPMAAPRRQRCPVCRCKVDLLITGGLGIVFKGEGFYVNDSRAAARSSAKTGGNRPDGGKPASAAADTRPQPGGAGEKSATTGDSAGQEKKSTDKAKD